MSVLALPKELRPRNETYRACALGVDLPASFMADLRGIDGNLYPVFHPYRILWDDIINDYSGSLEDPRYQIHRQYGELNFGYVLTNGKGEPTPDGTWHIWRLCRPHGWAHVINIDSTDEIYLNLLVDRLYLQAKFNDRYGHRGYSRHLQELDDAAREKAQQDRIDMMNDIKKVNSAMVSRAMNNFERGITKATNPTKDIIYSGAGINKKSKIVRPITDREGGLVLPDGCGE